MAAAQHHVAVSRRAAGLVDMIAMLPEPHCARRLGLGVGRLVGKGKKTSGSGLGDPPLPHAWH